VLGIVKEPAGRRMATVCYVVLRLDGDSARRRAVMGRAGGTKVAVRFDLGTATPGDDASKGVCSITHADDADKRRVEWEV
jgi:hypothetical protein